MCKLHLSFISRSLSLSYVSYHLLFGWITFLIHNVRSVLCKLHLSFISRSLSLSYVSYHLLFGWITFPFPFRNYVGGETIFCLVVTDHAPQSLGVRSDGLPSQIQLVESGMDSLTRLLGLIKEIVTPRFSQSLRQMNAESVTLPSKVSAREQNWQSLCPGLAPVSCRLQFIIIHFSCRPRLRGMPKNMMDITQSI